MAGAGPRTAAEGWLGSDHPGGPRKQGTDSFLWVLGLISLSIALLDLLPFLPLDGGHIVFAIVEGVRGRAVTREVYERVSIVGIGLVLLLFMIGLTNDIGRLS